MKKVVKKRTKRKTKRLLIAFFFFAVAIAIAGGYLYNRYLVPHQPKIKETTKKEEPIVEPDPKVEEIKKLYEENNDLVGWIKIDDTQIDYPVMHTANEDYYLYRDFYKQDYKPGSLFVDKYNNTSPRDINLIIHGHNMKDGSMFANLLKYKDQSFYNTHKKIIFYTLEEKQEYEIISVFLSKVYNVNDNVFKYYKFYGKKTETEYNDYIKNIKKLSLYNIELTATYPEELITLSTCESSQEDGRLVVVAKKIST